VEFVSFRSVHAYSPPKPILLKSQRSGELSDALKGTREAYFKENRPVRTPVYDRWKIPGGDRIKGPAIIEQEDTTTVIYPDQDAYLDSYGNIIIEIPST
jgi:N-methylhydantoinase A